MSTQTAQLNNARIAPRKMRFVANLIKGLPIKQAEAQLLFNRRRPSEPLLKLLRSAIANAKNKNMDVNKLFIQTIRVDGGPMLRRFLPRAQGRATPIQKKSSHVTLVLAEKDAAMQRFTITPPPKRTKKSTGKKAVQSKAPTVKNERPKEKKAGFLKRLFRRKSV